MAAGRTDGRFGGGGLIANNDHVTQVTAFPVPRAVGCNHTKRLTSMLPLDPLTRPNVAVLHRPPACPGFLGTGSLFFFLCDDLKPNTAMF